MKTLILSSVLLFAAGCAANQPSHTRHAADPANAADCCGMMPNAAMHDGKMAATQPATMPSATTYTCPMHPEVQSDRPGNCPKCGMALVPDKSGDKHDHH